MRLDEQSATVRCHYLTDGTVNFAFTIRRAEFFIPVGVLLKCFMEMSDKEIYDKICHAAVVVSVENSSLPVAWLARIGCEQIAINSLSVVQDPELPCTSLACSDESDLFFWNLTAQLSWSPSVGLSSQQISKFCEIHGLGFQNMYRIFGRETVEAHWVHRIVMHSVIFNTIQALSRPSL